MLGFILLLVLVTALVLALVLMPLLRPSDRGHSDVKHANVAVHRQRLAELEMDRASGTLSPEDYNEARADLERGLLADVSGPVEDLRWRRAPRLALSMALLVPALALTLYWSLGTPTPISAVAPVHPMPQDPAAQLAFIRENLSKLEDEVDARPEQIEGWLMLARSHRALDQLEQALAVYRRALEQLGEQPDVLADYAEALGHHQGGRLQGEPMALLQRALQVEPAHPKALWLAGVAARQTGDEARARQYWQRLLATLPPESRAAREMQQLLGEMGAGEATAPARLRVSVTVASGLAEGWAPDSTVFVFARSAEGSRMPLAVERHRLVDLPMELVLDADDAMAPSARLRAGLDVVVEARVSASGQARAEAGDLIGRSGPIRVGPENSVQILIDQKID